MEGIIMDTKILDELEVAYSQELSLVDGAGWIRNERRTHFGRATFIIDWYHGSEHIWDRGKVLFGEGTDATEKWAKVRESWLWDGHAMFFGHPSSRDVFP